MDITKNELLRVNRQLHKIGEHICTDCLIRMPRTEEYFQRSKSSGGFFSRCKTCRKIRQSAQARRRYKQNKQYREERKATAAKYYENNREKVLERIRRRSLERVLESK